MIIRLLSNIRQIYFQYSNYKYITLIEAIKRFFLHRSVKYYNIKKKDWKTYKTSDTIFIFGSGPSVNYIKPYQWDIINKHDSFGLNYFFLTEYPTTYYYLGYEPSSNDILKKSFTENIRKIYKNSLWFVPYKVLYRLLNPKTEPMFFPKNAKIARFKYPVSISKKVDEEFTEADFNMSLIYRGSIGIGITFAQKFGYKNIVLIGVDLHTYKHFYDNHPLMKEERKDSYKKSGITSKNDTFDGLLPNKKSKTKPMKDYYYSLNEIVFEPKGVNLYVGNKGNELSPIIPLYPEFKK